MLGVMLLASPTLTEIGYRLVVKVLSAPFPSTSTLNGLPVPVVDDPAPGMNLLRAVGLRQNQRLFFVGAVGVLFAAFGRIIGQLCHFEPRYCLFCTFRTAMRFSGDLFDLRVGMTEQISVSPGLTARAAIAPSLAFLADGLHDPMNGISA